MSTIESIPVENYVIREIESGDETAFGNFDLAKDFLLKMREERSDSRWYMYAEIDV